MATRGLRFPPGKVKADCGSGYPGTSGEEDYRKDVCVSYRIAMRAGG
jgi:hypothetical protein